TLRARLRAEPDVALIGKTILVYGEARRVTIYFNYGDGIRSSVYYYQTHVTLTDHLQLEIIKET
ncbi:MAG: hypothetical protein ABI650_08860, partial [Dokdonella sp.]